MVEATGLCSCSAEMTGLVHTEEQGGKEREVLDSRDNKLKCILHF